MSGKISSSSSESDGSAAAFDGEQTICQTNTPGDQGTSTRSMQAVQQWIGKTLGKYEITGILGRGGMGIVLKGHDILIDRDVAIKLLPEDLASDKVSLDRFLTEARAAGKLTHANVVAIYDVGQEGASHYLVMELVSGGSIDDLVSKGKPYTPADATRIMIDACQGMQAAHAVGLVHRDIKPANLLRTITGQVKVTDFGIVKEIRASSHATQTGVVVGTPYFMSPEQCEGRPVDFRSDIYSLGATYYSLLTGQSPYSNSTSAIQVMFAHCQQPPPDPSQIDPSIPATCVGIVKKAMGKLPGDRYQTTAEMLHDLNVVAASFSGTAGIANLNLTQQQIATLLSLSRSHTPVNRRRMLGMTAGAVGLAAVGAGLSAAFWNSRKAEQPQAVLPPPVDLAHPIKVGILHSLSGTMSASESPVVNAVMLAIEEVNQAGGLLGRQIKPIVADGKSNDDIFAAQARRLISEEGVCAVFGGWTSSSRKTMKPVFEELNHLLLYPVQYEGLESSPNIVYLGAAPNQQILPAVSWARNTLQKNRFFFVGSDYVFPRAAYAIVQDDLKARGGELVGEGFIPIGSEETDAVIQKIRDSKPDMILNAINGDSNTHFFRALRKAGITPETIPTLSFSIGESELRTLDRLQMQGDYAAWTYFESIDSSANKAFVKRFLERDPQLVINDPMESAYVGVKLWAQAVQEAGSIEPKAIRHAILSQRFDAPHGPVRLDAETQHVYKTPRVGKIRDDGQFDIVWAANESVAPEPFPATRSAEDWKAFLHDLYVRWNHHWSLPTT